MDLTYSFDKPIDSILHIRGYVWFLVITESIFWLIILIKLVIEKKVKNMKTIHLKSNNMT